MLQSGEQLKSETVGTVLDTDFIQHLSNFIESLTSLKIAIMSAETKPISRALVTCRVYLKGFIETLTPYTKGKIYFAIVISSISLVYYLTISCDGCYWKTRAQGNR
jgi:hypothetical protein